MSSLFSPHRLALYLVLLAANLCQAEPIFFDYRQLLAEPAVRATLNPGIKIYLQDDVQPTLAETAPPDTFTGIGLSISPFGGSRRHCVEAFSNALAPMVRDAVRGGFDTIVALQVEGGDVSSMTQTGFACTPAYKATIVRLSGIYGTTAAGFQRALAAEQRLLTAPYRAPWEETIYVPLAPMLEAKEIKALMSGPIHIFWGLDTPEYRSRIVAESYEGSAPLNREDLPASCQQAVANAIQAMIDNTADSPFDTLMRVRSFRYEQTTPGLASIECEIGKKAVYVTLQATMAIRR